MRVRKSTALLFVAPFLLFFLLFWLLPLLFGGYMSVSKYSLITGNEGFVGLDNYIKILASDSMYNRSFFLGLKNTLLFVGISVPPLVLGSLALALLLDHLPARLQPAFRTLYFISYSVSVTAVSAIFVWLLKGNGGYINNLLVSLHIVKQPIPWLESQPFVWAALLIATLWWTVGYNTMLFVNALNEIDTQMYEAAAIDGAGFFAKLKSIILPGIRKVFFFVLMTTIIASFNLYGQPRLMTAGGPGESTKPLIMVIHNTIMERNNMGIGTAMALLMGLLVTVCSVGQYFLTREKKLLEDGGK